MVSGIGESGKREESGAGRHSKQSRATLSVAVVLAIWFALVFLLGADGASARWELRRYRFSSASLRRSLYFFSSSRSGRRFVTSSYRSIQLS